GKRRVITHLRTGHGTTSRHTANPHRGQQTTVSSHRGGRLSRTTGSGSSPTATDDQSARSGPEVARGRWPSWAHPLSSARGPCPGWLSGRLTGRYPLGRRYSAPCALRMAWTPSSTLSSGVVLNALQAPPAATAIEN